MVKDPLSPRTPVPANTQNTYNKGKKVKTKGYNLVPIEKRDQKIKVKRGKAK